MIRYTTKLPAPGAAKAVAKKADVGSPLPARTDNIPYGQRVEADGSWTVYEVSSGTPVTGERGLLTGLSEAEAAAEMTLFNSGKAAETIASPTGKASTQGNH